MNTSHTDRRRRPLAARGWFAASLLVVTGVMVKVADAGSISQSLVGSETCRVHWNLRGHVSTRRHRDRGWHDPGLFQRHRARAWHEHRSDSRHSSLRHGADVRQPG
jgi:hypothetical protein